MPRLRKETIDKIEEMIKKDYLDVEILEKTSVSRPTIRKIRRRLESAKGGKESEKSVENETIGKKTVIEMGEGDDYEKVEFLDLKGKKVRFIDVVAEFLVKSGIFPLEKATLTSVLFEMLSEEFQELRDAFLNTMSARLVEEFICNECGSEKSVVKIWCAKCGKDFLWGSKPE